ncbi:ADP-ribosylglycohydrolase family protein [Pseudoflavonifractor phocaeensis]|uniref:ADP-ribosylglycohydrolase family protein n=1 Tax=Pseudoflavonifractor phocaeensis TaxID=1870988 RepID=UPI001958B904|nr:ADP-ribosylglycohydrolase family protein [Pseudoflavonifractor phocaeensis]MBM6869265.1 ADP-ribosylglycohydrolase family protein [Pseudoflavonifractor phocaeensis]
MTIQKQDAFFGCLLGGAVGDALGYPVEFMNEASIYSRFGPDGIQRLDQAGQPALISDDTQMTLFAAEGILYAKAAGTALHKALWTAYLEWLGTQGDQSRMDPEHPKTTLYREPRLHARRAPGNTCLASLHHSRHGGTPEEPVNNSKGCGTVMRAAPFGLAYPEPEQAFQSAVCDGALTHGHPLGYLSSGGLALMVREIVYGASQGERLEAVLLRGAERGDGDFRALLLPDIRRAVELALDPAVSDLEGVHALGQGWVAEEALYIAVFCAVRHQDDFCAALRAAVNHKGDSDSTGAVCGNILGAWLGREGVEAAFNLKDLELADVIVETAQTLFQSTAGDGV